MLAYRTPGVYFERPQARPAIRRLPTDVAGFVGIARSGPLHHPVRVTSWPEFVAVFGGHTVQGYLAYAVEGFFANGGRTCWVVRVADPAAARAAGLDLAGAGGAPVGRLTAASPGTWARELTVTAVGTAPGRFTLIVRGAGGVRELWRELDLDPAGERWIGAVLNDRDTGSRLLRVCPAAAPAMGESALRVIEGRLGVARPSGGADGLATLTADHLAAAGSVFPFDDPCAGQARTGEPWGLAALERIDEVSVVAMPDAVPRLRVEVVTRERPRRCDVLPADDGEPAPPPAAHLPDEEPPDRTPDRSAADVARLQRELIAHCERLRDRVALLDVPPAAAGGGDVPEQVLLWRRDFTSRWAAAYWPWLVVPEPLPTGELLTRLPPSGHVAGIIARSDLRAGVHKPPANERLEGVEDVAFALDDPAHGDLNEAGIDAVRPYPGRGIRVAGARTLDREPAQRYLNVRRLLIFIAESIEEQVQWTVFEPHNRRLRQQVDRVVRAFLLGLWRDGMLDGAKESEAFHVACDETTNPPEEVETGRLICEIGVLPPWPAEFVVARIGISEGGVELIEDQAPGEGGRG